LAGAFLITPPVISMRLQSDQLCAGGFAEERSHPTEKYQPSSLS
jgi:hypothetical protein